MAIVEEEIEALEKGGPDQQSVTYDPEALTAALVAEKKAKIGELDAVPSTTNTLLFSTFKEQYAPEGFVIYRSMLRVFDEYGVLAGYFSMRSRDGARFSDTKDGWQLKLRRPESTGLFEVKFVKESSKRHNKQTVHYLAAA